MTTQLNRRQFLAACLMLIVAACLLDLERLREWWKSVGGDEISAFAIEMRKQMDLQYEAFGRQMSKYLWGQGQESLAFAK